MRWEEFLRIKWRTLLLAIVGLSLGSGSANAMLRDICDSDSQLVMMIASYREEYGATQTEAASAMKEAFGALSGGQSSMWTISDSMKIDALAAFAYCHAAADPKDVAMEFLKACRQRTPIASAMLKEYRKVYYQARPAHGAA